MNDPRQVRAEGLQPFRHSAPDTLLNKLKFEARLLTDFQVRTVYRALRKVVPGLRGKVIDVGCGESPYRHLTTEGEATYTGIDIQDAGKFGYENSAAIHFDGRSISAPDESFDHFICTEVLEHAEDPEALVAEMHRILKKGGTGLVTVPWSARYHYIPFDYHRFTPSALEKLFAAFSSVEIEPRGTDLTSIAAKIIVACLRGITPRSVASLPRVAIASTFLPIAGAALAVGHLSLILDWGSSDDPLGYIVRVRR
jgi:SAM-dependent methyltransferase